MSYFSTSPGNAGRGRAERSNGPGEGSFFRKALSGPAATCDQTRFDSKMMSSEITATLFVSLCDIPLTLRLAGGAVAEFGRSSLPRRIFPIAARRTARADVRSTRKCCSLVNVALVAACSMLQSPFRQKGPAFTIIRDYTRLAAKVQPGRLKLLKSSDRSVLRKSFDSALWLHQNRSTFTMLAVVRFSRADLFFRWSLY